MPRPTNVDRVAAAPRRALRYADRIRRAFSILYELGRVELFRAEARTTLARLDYPHEDIYLRVDSRYAPMRAKSCSKEPWTVDWIERVVERGETVYDVGANVGAYTLVAAKLGRRVVAVEAAYATFAALCDNVIVNDAADAVYPLAVALGAETQLDFFNYRDLEPGAGLNTTGDRAGLNGRFAPIYRQPVLSYRLDDLVEQFGLPAPNHVKLDVDGAELDVLRGAPRTLESAELRTVLVEVNEDETDALVELLRGHGLELRERFDPVTRHGHWYGLFARP